MPRVAVLHQVDRGSIMVRAVAAGTCLVLMIFVIGDAHGLGIGIVVGEPTGITAKQWLGKGNALAGAAAWSFDDESAFQVHLDYLVHRPALSTEDAGRALFYFGIGGRLKAQEDDSRVGVRIPLGVDYVFAGSPIDIFIEVAPLLDVAPSTEFTVNGGFGVRYYF